MVDEARPRDARRRHLVLADRSHETPNDLVAMLGQDAGETDSGQLGLRGRPPGATGPSPCPCAGRVGTPDGGLAGENDVGRIKRFGLGAPSCLPCCAPATGRGGSWSYPERVSRAAVRRRRG